MASRATATDYIAANWPVLSLGKLLAALIGVAPVLTVLFSWGDPGSDIGSAQRVVKALAIPVVAVEVLLIALAFGSGPWAPSKPSRSRLAAGAALLALSLGTAALAAPDPPMAFTRTALWIVHLSFAWSIYRLCQRGVVNRETLSAALMAGFLVFCGAIVLFISQVENPATFNWLNGLPGLDNIRRAAYFAAPIAGLAIAGLSAPAGKGRALAALAYALAVALIFWSGARGAAAAIGAAWLISILLFPQLRDRRAMVRVASATAAGVVLGWLYCLRTGFPGLWRMLPEVAGGVRVDLGYSVTSGRTELWASTWQTILNRPLLGYGEGQAAYAVPVAQDTLAFHPHNLPLQLLLAWGIVGTLLVLFLAAPLAKRSLENARRHGDCLGPFIAMLVLLLYSAVDGTLFHVHAVSLFAACAGMTAWHRTGDAQGVR